MDLQEIIKLLEMEYIKILINNLKFGKMKLDRAKMVTKDFLTLLPFKDKDDLVLKIKTFTELQNEFKMVYLTLLKINEEQKSNELAYKMRELIKQNKIDEALKLVE